MSINELEVGVVDVREEFDERDLEDDDLERCFDLGAILISLGLLPNPI